MMMIRAARLFSPAKPLSTLRPGLRTSGPANRSSFAPPSWRPSSPPPYVKTTNPPASIAPSASATRRVNRDINAPFVHLIRADGKSAGTVPLAQALAEAQQAQLDLVEVGAAASPPVCKIQKNSVPVQPKIAASRPPPSLAKLGPNKDITLGTAISDYDFSLKMKKARDFLLGFHPVKIVVQFSKSSANVASDRPRLAQELLNRASDSLTDYGTSISTDKFTQGHSSRMFMPKNNKR